MKICEIILAHLLSRSDIKKKKNNLKKCSEKLISC